MSRFILCFLDCVFFGVVKDIEVVCCFYLNVCEFFWLFFLKNKDKWMFSWLGINESKVDYIVIYVFCCFLEELRLRRGWM